MRSCGSPDAIAPRFGHAQIWKLKNEMENRCALTKLPSMPFFPADFFADTRHLSGEEQGVYAVMLFHAWLSDGRLPADEKALLKILRVHWRTWRTMRDHILPFWSTSVQDRFITQSRLIQDRSRIVSRFEQNKINGAKGGRPKSLLSNISTKPVGYDRDNLSETQKNPYQNQNQNYKKESLNGELRQESGEEFEVARRRQRMRKHWNEFWPDKCRALEALGWTQERIEARRLEMLESFPSAYGLDGWN